MTLLQQINELLNSTSSCVCQCVECVRDCVAGVLKESIWRRLCLGVGVLDWSGTVCDDGNAELEDSLIRYANRGAVLVDRVPVGLHV